MPLIELDSARKHLARARRRNWRRKIWLLVLPVTSHLASVIGIAVIWFGRSGSLKFDPNSRWDWVALVVSGFILISGFELIRRALPPQTSFRLTRVELSEILALNRSTARTSIHIVAGDLSWLSDDLDTLIEQKQRQPALRIHIHYERSRVAHSEIARIETLDKANVKLHPYADSYLSARFTVVDLEDVASRRVFTYEKMSQKNPISRANEQFTWEQFYPDAGPMNSSLCSVVNLLMAAPITPIRVGVSGINNVGKTSFAKMLRAELVRDFRVELIPDQFPLVPNGIGIDGNVVILLKELLAKSPRPHIDVAIYDRTVLDNLLFFKLRAPYSEIFERMIEQVVYLIKSFDIILYLRRSAEDDNTSTTFVTPAQRCKINEIYNDCLAAYDINVYDVISQNNDVEGSLSAAASDAAKLVREIHYKKRIAPI